MRSWTCRRPRTTSERTGERSARSVEDERLTARIREVHEQNFECYGYPRVWHELQRQGEQVGRDRVARLMRQEGIQGRQAARQAVADHDRRSHRRRSAQISSSATSPRPARSAVGRRSDLPAHLGGTDVLRVPDRRVLADDRRLAARDATCAPTWCSTRCAWRWAPDSPASRCSWWQHTDQGSQYTAEDYTQVLDDHHVLASVGTVGDCYDNALSESFVDSYKTELIADRVWRTNAQLELATVTYVGWFNHRRLHSSIGNRPPVEHEREYWARVALGLEPFPAQAAPTVTDLRDVLTLASPMYGSEQSH